MFACLFYRESPGWYIIVSTQGALNLVGSHWRTLLVSNCFLAFHIRTFSLLISTAIYSGKTVVPKSMFLSFSFLECADTSRNDLELESEWKRLPKALTMQANISGRTMETGNHELVCWQTSSLKVHFHARYGRLQFFTLQADPKPVNNEFIFISSGFV